MGQHVFQNAQRVSEIQIVSLSVFGLKWNDDVKDLSDRRIQDPGMFFPYVACRKRQVPFELGAPSQDSFLPVDKGHEIDILLIGVIGKDIIRREIFLQEMGDINLEDFGRGVELLFDRILNVVLDVIPVNRGKHKKNEKDAR